MANPKQMQLEIDGLRDQVRRMRQEHEATTKELEALRSGKAEAAAIAESAEVHAAKSDNWQSQYEELAKYTADLIQLVRYHEANTAPPPEVAQRVRYKMHGQPLDNRVPPKGVAS